MTERQRCFAEYYAANPNATAAAKAAGYSDRTAYSQGVRLLKNVEILKYISDLQGMASKKRVADIEEVKQTWTEILRNDREKSKDRMRAGELIARSAGEFVKPSQRQDGSERESDSADEMPETVIQVPYNGNGAANAVELADGTIVPLAGDENNDVLVYIPFRSYDPHLSCNAGEE